VPDLSTLAVFSLAAFALIAIPGPAVLYIVAQSVDHGRRAGLISTLGIEAGAMVHVAAATVGLSSLLASSATAFTIIKYCGAAYLVFLGIRRLLTRVEVEKQTVVTARRHLFRDGVVVNALNPKTALFFLAFLPQFVDTGRGAAWLQIFILGMVFILVAFVSDTAWAITAGTVGGWLKRSTAYLAFRRWISGLVFIGLGASATRAH